MSYELEKREIEAIEKLSTEQLETEVENHIPNAIYLARVLVVLRDRGEYLKTHSSFAVYCEHRFQKSKSSIYRLLLQAGVEKMASRAGTPTPKLTHAEALSTLPKNLQMRAWKKALKSAATQNREVTLNDVKIAIEEVKPKDAPEETAAPATPASKPAAATPPELPSGWLPNPKNPSEPIPPDTHHLTGEPVTAENPQWTGDEPQKPAAGPKMITEAACKTTMLEMYELLAGWVEDQGDDTPPADAVLAELKKIIDSYTP